MNTLNLSTATSISNRALAVGREISAAPLTVVILDAGGHMISLQREDGASLLRPQIAIGKAWGALALGKGSRLIAADAQQRPAFIGAVNNLADGKLVPAPGGVLIRNQQGAVIGAIGITGDTSDIDEQCAISAVESVGLQADAGIVA
ncbi:heme-binding protein [Pseudomonas sp.]|uniref:GlcG/HbpS family heme-binding protein n=1 Tax=Pseudomonas sp. TaxID=306 RepID=UPI002736A029|nr:heme-binding protein [Pseudomonas sp.]MDP3815170.1 heme-binding protein [Pseudomonas sp.]